MLITFSRSITCRACCLVTAVFSKLYDKPRYSFLIMSNSTDYFHKDRPRDLWTDRHPAVRLLGVFGKMFWRVLRRARDLDVNSGCAGQGILTILLGIMLLDFSGKAHSGI